MTERREASIWQTKKKLVVSSLSQATSGLWIGSEPCVGLDLTVPDDVLGEKVREALAASRMGVPIPTDWKLLDKPLLQAAAVPTMSRFNDGAKSLGATLLGPELILRPSIRGERKGAFVPVPEKDFTIPSQADDGAVGAAVRRALALCQAW